MTQAQTIAVIGVAVALLYSYGPQLQSLTMGLQKKSTLLEDLETVTRIRRTYSGEAVSEACRGLLEALLQVKQ